MSAIRQIIGCSVSDVSDSPALQGQGAALENCLYGDKSAIVKHHSDQGT